LPDLDFIAAARNVTDCDGALDGVDPATHLIKPWAPRLRSTDIARLEAACDQPRAGGRTRHRGRDHQDVRLLPDELHRRPDDQPCGRGRGAARRRAHPIPPDPRRMEGRRGGGVPRPVAGEITQQQATEDAATRASRAPTGGAVDPMIEAPRRSVAHGHRVVRCVGERSFCGGQRR
jgi:hypothetical protein